MDRVAECRERARFERQMAAAAMDVELRERHLNRAALWSAIADLQVRNHEAALQGWLDARSAGEAADPEFLEDYLCEVTARGTA